MDLGLGPMLCTALAWKHSLGLSVPCRPLPSRLASFLLCWLEPPGGVEQKPGTQTFWLWTWPAGRVWYPHLTALHQTLGLLFSPDYWSFLKFCRQWMVFVKSAHRLSEMTSLFLWWAVLVDFCVEPILRVKPSPMATVTPFLDFWSDTLGTVHLSVQEGYSVDIFSYLVILLFWWGGSVGGACCQVWQLEFDS